LKGREKMTKQDSLRIRMNALFADYGTRQNFICERTGIFPSTLTKFKKDNLNLNDTECERLDQFLTERGYGDDLKAITSIIQSNFNS